MLTLETCGNISSLVAHSNPFDMIIYIHENKIIFLCKINVRFSLLQWSLTHVGVLVYTVSLFYTHILC